VGEDAEPGVADQETLRSEPLWGGGGGGGGGGECVLAESTVTHDGALHWGRKDLDYETTAATSYRMLPDARPPFTRDVHHPS